jgi:hypothetical protein
VAAFLSLPGAARRARFSCSARFRFNSDKLAPLIDREAASISKASDAAVIVVRSSGDDDIHPIRVAEALAPERAVVADSEDPSPSSEFQSPNVPEPWFQSAVGIPKIK